MKFLFLIKSLKRNILNTYFGIIYIRVTDFLRVYWRDGKDFDQDHVVTKLDNGMPIIVNKHDRCVCWFVRLTGHWDINETFVLEKIIKKDFKIIEVGANFGVHTLRMAKLIGCQGKIFAFEANSTVSKYLKKSIEMNCLDNISLFEKAAGEKSAESHMSFDILNIGAGHLTSSEKPGSVKTEIVKLDDVISEYHIDLLKIDAEGYEYKIFKGAKNIIDKNEDHIILMIEWVQNHLKNQDSNPLEVVEFLKSYNFKIWRIGNKKKDEQILVPISYDELIALEDCDILASKLDLDQ